MIGGQDIHIAVPSGAAAMGSAVRAVGAHWPDAVFVPDNGVEIVERCDDLGFHDTSEVVIYKDRAACEKWRAIGYDQSLKGTMVYLIADREGLTIVIEDEPSEETKLLVPSIREALGKTFRPVRR